MAVKARYSRVSRRLWRDAKVRRLSPPQPCGRHLWVHLLTMPEERIPGLIPIGAAALAEELEWEAKGFAEAFGEVFREGLAKADWEARLVWIPNRIHHDPPASTNVIRSWSQAWDVIPECPLKDEAFRELRAWAKAKGKAWAKAFDEALGHPSPIPEPDPEPDPAPSDEGVARAHEAETTLTPPLPHEADAGGDERTLVLARAIAVQPKLACLRPAVHVAQELLGGLGGNVGKLDPKRIPEAVAQAVADLETGALEGRCRKVLRWKLSDAIKAGPAPPRRSRPVSPPTPAGPAEPIIQLDARQLGRDLVERRPPTGTEDP